MDNFTRAIRPADARAAADPDPGEPLIVTLALDEDSFRHLDALRQRHFPPERNWLNAHLTLFHRLPAGQLEPIRASLDAAARVTPCIALEFPAPLFLGRGVAVTVQAPALCALRAQLAGQFAPWLTPQDRQGFRPHVTVQNKVAPSDARLLHERLRASWQPRVGEGRGLQLWRYRGGPWTALAEFAFAPSGVRPGTAPHA